MRKWFQRSTSKETTDEPQKKYLSMKNGEVVPKESKPPQTWLGGSSKKTLEELEDVEETETPSISAIQRWLPIVFIVSLVLLLFGGFLWYQWMAPTEADQPTGGTPMETPTTPSTDTTDSMIKIQALEQIQQYSSFLYKWNEEEKTLYLAFANTKNTATYLKEMKNMVAKKQSYLQGYQSHATLFTSSLEEIYAIGAQRISLSLLLSEAIVEAITKKETKEIPSYFTNYSNHANTLRQEEEALVIRFLEENKIFYERDNETNQIIFSLPSN